MPHPAGPHGGANVPILKLPQCGGRERPPYRARETAATNREIAAAGTPAGWFGPLVKGGWLRRKPQTGGLFRSRQPFPKGCAGGPAAVPERLRRGGTLRVAAASGGGISGRGNPSARAWRRGHLPLTREANCRAGLVANRKTMISMLLRTRVGADSISARSAAAQTSPGGYGIRPYKMRGMWQPLPGAAFRGKAIPPTAPGGAATSL